jgi:hypothetical protein
MVVLYAAEKALCTKGSLSQAQPWVWGIGARDGTAHAPLDGRALRGATTSRSATNYDSASAATAANDGPLTVAGLPQFVALRRERAVRRSGAWQCSAEETRVVATGGAPAAATNFANPRKAWSASPTWPSTRALP